MRLFSKTAARSRARPFAFAIYSDTVLRRDGERGLSPNQADDGARTPQRQTLRFSRSGDPAIEARYRTHWVSPKLSEKKRERLIEEASRAPELVVIQPLKSDWTCHRCAAAVIS